MKIKLLLLLVVILVAAVYGWCRYYQDDTMVLYGNVDTDYVSLAFNGSERIEKLYKNTGDTVKKGELLAELNSEAIKLNIEKIQASIVAQEAVLNKLKNGSRPQEIGSANALVRSAEAAFQDAMTELKRSEELYAAGAVSKQQYDARVTAYKTAEAALHDAGEKAQLVEEGSRSEDIEQAAAQLESLKKELKLQEYYLSQTQLVAPEDSIVRSRLLQVGDMASQAKPVFILTPANCDALFIRAYIDEKNLGKISIGQKTRIISDSFPDSPCIGYISYISDTAEFTPKSVQTEELRTTLVYEIRILPNGNAEMLRKGMPVTIRVEGE